MLLSTALGILYERMGQLDKAEAEYKDVLKLDSRYGDARRRLADIYSLRGNFTRSIEEYTALVRLRGDNPVLHFRLARVYEKNRDYLKAIAEYLEAIRLSPGDLEARKELASLYGRRGMAAEAEDQYRNILKVDRDDREIRNSLASSYVKRKEYDRLLELLKEGVELAPADAASHYRLGVLYEFRREFPSAEAEYEKTIALDKGHGKALYALGRLCIKLSDLDRAKQYLEAARAADPDFVEPRELLSSLRDDLAMRSGRNMAVSHKGKKVARSKRKKTDHHKKTRSR